MNLIDQYNIFSIQFEHPLIRGLVVMEEPVFKEDEVSNAPVISECFRVTAAVIPILIKFGYE